MCPSVFLGNNLLSTLLLVPLTGSLIVFLIPGQKRVFLWTIALVWSLIALIGTLAMLVLSDPAPGLFDLVEASKWIPPLGIQYVLGVDGLSTPLSVLTALLTFLVVASSLSVQRHLKQYLACILLLEMGMLGTFFAIDAVTFYVFWELMLIPMYFLIGIWGGERRVYAALKFVIFTATGSILMLVAIVYLGVLHLEQRGELSFLIGDWAKLALSGREEVLLFAAFAAAFAIKIPLVPLHTWLPDAHVEAPTGGSVLLAGVLLKMGLYGILRFGPLVFPNALSGAAPLFFVLGVVGIVYGALVAWQQTDIKKLVAYSSVSHMGFCILGLACLNELGFQGCILQMLNHGVSTGALFLLVGFLYERTHSRLISDHGGLAARMPRFSVFLMIFVLSSIALPATNGFVGEFLILLAAFGVSPLGGVMALSGVVLGAVYMLSMYRRVCFEREGSNRLGSLNDLGLIETAVLLPLVVFVFFVGCYPQPLLDKTGSFSKYTSSIMGSAHIPTSKRNILDSDCIRSQVPGRTWQIIERRGRK